MTHAERTLRAITEDRLAALLVEFNRRGIHVHDATTMQALRAAVAAGLSAGFAMGVHVGENEGERRALTPSGN